MCPMAVCPLAVCLLPVCLVRCACDTFENVEHLHRRRHDGVVLTASKIKVGLAQQRMQLAARFEQGFAELLNFFGTRRAGGNLFCRTRAQTLLNRCPMLISERPQAPQETLRALNPGARPFECLLGRTGKHREEAGGVGTILVNLGLGVDAIVF